MQQNIFKTKLEHFSNFFVALFPKNFESPCLSVNIKGFLFCLLYGELNIFGAWSIVFVKRIKEFGPTLNVSGEEIERKIRNFNSQY